MTIYCNTVYITNRKRHKSIPFLEFRKRKKLQSTKESFEKPESFGLQRAFFSLKTKNQSKNPFCEITIFSQKNYSARTKAPHKSIGKNIKQRKFNFQNLTTLEKKLYEKFTQISISIRKKSKNNSLT